MSDLIWKDIPGYEGQYQASSDGRVRSLRNLKLTLATDTGYPVVTITGQERSAVHTLVAKTFIGPRPLGMQVNHIDGNRENNRVENLEYVTPSENLRHSFRIGNRKLYFTDAQMDQIAEWYFMDGNSVASIVKRFLPDVFTTRDRAAMRKRVQSVITIWRAHRRPAKRRNPWERKLSLDIARKIRAIYATGEADQTQIARMFVVHSSHVSRIVAGILWKEPRKANHPQEMEP